MDDPSKYWIKIEVPASGHGFWSREKEPAKVFFQGQFLQDSEPERLDNPTVQGQLVATWRTALTTDVATTTTNAAVCCLQCFTSQALLDCCQALERRFGAQHQLQLQELLPLALDSASSVMESSSSARPPFFSLTDQILESFDPNQGQLSTWSKRLFQSNREIQQVLLEHRIEWVRDEAILCQTKPTKLERLLREFYHRSDDEITMMVQQLTVFHQIYRQDVLAARQQVNQQRKAVGKGATRRAYPAPSLEQLNAMGQRLNPPAPLSPETVRRQLQTLAKLLRDYRIYRKGGPPPAVVSLEQLEQHHRLDAQGAQPIAPLPKTQSASTELSALFEEQCKAYLPDALNQVIQTRVNNLKKKKPEKAEKFLKALELFHCQGLPMGQIAPKLGWKSQSQVTRLLKLDELRADVARQILVHLQQKLLDLAQASRQLEDVKQAEQQIQTFLASHLADVMQAAKEEALNSKSRSMTSLFSTTLCHCLHQRNQSHDEPNT